MEAIQVIEDDRILLLQPKRTGAGKGGPCGLGGQAEIRSKTFVFHDSGVSFWLSEGAEIEARNWLQI